MNRLSVLSGVAVGLSLAMPAGAVTVVNGDFSGGLAGWTTVGPVSVVGGRAVLQEDPVTQITTLQQQLAIPPLACSLSFGYEFTSTPDGTSGYPWPDAFTASLLDPATGDPIRNTAGFPDYFYRDNDGLIDYDPAIVTLVGDRVRLDLTTIPADTPALLAFDLLGGSEGYATEVALDGVRVGVIPEPLTGAGLLLTVGLVGACLRRRLTQSR